MQSKDFSRANGFLRYVKLLPSQHNGGTGKRLWVRPSNIERLKHPTSCMRILLRE